MVNHRRRRRRNRNTQAQPQVEAPPPATNAEGMGRPPRVIIPKTYDEGPLMINCTIRGIAFNDCLCDTGASISIMSLSIARRLRLQGYRTQFGRMTLADQETTRQVILLENVPVVVDNVIVLTDFAVLSTGGEQNDGLILGRPFLQSTDAILHVSTGVVTLRIGSRQQPMYARVSVPVDPQQGTSRTFEHNINTVSHVWDPWPSQPRTPAFIKEQEDPSSLTASCSINDIKESESFDRMRTSIENITEKVKVSSNKEFRANALTLPQSCYPRIIDKPRGINLPKMGLPKHEDPGIPVINCVILGTALQMCMCDTGASGSCMSTIMARSLGLEKYITYNGRVALADESTIACGLLKDIPVEIGNFFVPTDFGVIDMPEDAESPIIFGRPFLLSTRALIDSYWGTVTLRLDSYYQPTFTKYGLEISRENWRETYSSYPYE